VTQNEITVETAPQHDTIQTPNLYITQDVTTVSHYTT